VLRRVDSTQYGALLLDVIALQLETSGAIGDILSVLDEILDDVNDKQVEADDLNAKTVADCNEKEDKYTKIIHDAEFAIAQAEDYLGFLESEKRRLESEIDRVEAAMNKNRADKASAIQERESAHELYLSRLQEHEESIAACDEAIELLEQLKNTSAPTMIQVRKTSTTLMNLREKIQKMDGITSTYTPFLKVLLEIAASQENFSNQETVNQVNSLLNELKSDLEDSKEALIEEEEAAQEAHDAYVTELDTIYAALTEELAQLYTDLANVVNEIGVQHNIIDTNTVILNDTKATL